jgi:hypothetical protein
MERAWRISRWREDNKLVTVHRLWVEDASSVYRKFLCVLKWSSGEGWFLRLAGKNHYGYGPFKTPYREPPFEIAESIVDAIGVGDGR